VCDECPARLAADLEAAFPAFVSHHEDLVYGMALRATRAPADAEDLAQEAFLRAYRALRGYGPERVATLRARGWLAAILLNLARNRARRRPPAAAALDGQALDRPTDPLVGPEALAERRETDREWRARLRALPESYRLAVELRHVEGLSYPELAQALGRPVGTVKSDVHRGVALLRRAWLAESGTAEGPGDGRTIGRRATRARRAG
jgi:RNA polymerase sigma factor (sigma-70 family)